MEHTIQLYFIKGTIEYKTNSKKFREYQGWFENSFQEINSGQKYSGKVDVLLLLKKYNVTFAFL